MEKGFEKKWAGKLQAMALKPTLYWIPLIIFIVISVCKSNVVKFVISLTFFYYNIGNITIYNWQKVSEIELIDLWGWNGILILKFSKFISMFSNLVDSPYVSSTTFTKSPNMNIRTCNN